MNLINIDEALITGSSKHVFEMLESENNHGVVVSDGDTQTSLDGDDDAYVPKDLERIALRDGTEDAIALVFRSMMEGKVCYVHERGQWMQWTGKQWVADPTGACFDQLRTVIRNHNPNGLKSMGKASFVKGVETLCKHDRAFARSIVQFDCDNYLLNTAGGVVDLRTGEIRPQEPGMMLSKYTPTAPSKQGGTEFQKAINEICAGDQELINFHKVSLGSMLSGAVQEHWFLFWYGQGRNGKNLLADVVYKAFGGYAHKMPSEALMSQKNERHPTDLAALAGQRMVLSSEVPDGSHWNESRIKELTGDENLSARFMRQDSFTFKRTHKHLALGNYRPHLQSNGTGIVSRLKLVPFNVSFSGREDPDLPAKLEAELPFILNWLIEGHMQWIENGKRLPKCAAVDEASKDYFGAQATVHMWVNECCNLVSKDDPVSSYPKLSVLYANYNEWKKARGENPVSMQRWSENMGSLGLEKKNSDGVRYIGIRTKLVQH